VKRVKPPTPEEDDDGDLTEVDMCKGLVVLADRGGALAEGVVIGASAKNAGSWKVKFVADGRVFARRPDEMARRPESRDVRAKYHPGRESRDGARAGKGSRDDVRDRRADLLEGRGGRNDGRDGRVGRDGGADGGEGEDGGSDSSEEFDERQQRWRPKRRPKVEHASMATPVKTVGITYLSSSAGSEGGGGAGEEGLGDEYGENGGVGAGEGGSEDGCGSYEDDGSDGSDGSDAGEGSYGGGAFGPSWAQEGEVKRGGGEGSRAMAKAASALEFMDGRQSMSREGPS
jgi:hypothetical protein